MQEGCNSMHSDSVGLVPNCGSQAALLLTLVTASGLFSMWYFSCLIQLINVEHAPPCFKWLWRLEGIVVHCVCSACCSWEFWAHVGDDFDLCVFTCLSDMTSPGGTWQTSTGWWCLKTGCLSCLALPNWIFCAYRLYRAPVHLWWYPEIRHCRLRLIVILMPSI